MATNASFDFEQYLLPDIAMEEHTSWNDNDSTIEQPQHETDSDTLKEILSTLNVQSPISVNGEVSPVPSPVHTSPASNILSWAAPAMIFPMVPANPMLCGIPLPNSSSILDASFGSNLQFPFTPSFTNAYGNGDIHMLTSAGLFMYPQNHGISPSGTLHTEPTSPPWLDTPSPSASAPSPSETSMTEDSDVYHHNGYISDPSPPAVSGSSSSSLSSTRRLARTRVSHSSGAYRPPTEITTTLPPLAKFNSAASRGTKRKIDLFELEDSTPCDYDDGEGDIDSEEDEYQPTADSDSEEESDIDAPSPSSLASSKRSSPRAFTSTTVIQTVASTNPRKNRSLSKPRELVSKKVFLNDGRTKAVGGFVCGMITQWKGKGGQYTAKGIRTPEVGEVCEMRTRNWSDMVRHQQNTFWHSPPGACQRCKARLNDRRDNMSRHGPACKGPKNAKRAPAKKPTKKARK